MESLKQFCELKTLEKAKKDSEELTKKEIVKLQETIELNLKLLQKNYNVNDDELSTISSTTEYSDDDDDSTYVPDNYEKESKDDNSNIHIHYKKSTKRKYADTKKDLLKYSKKDIEIEELEKKDYYKNLELNNLTIENSSLKDELKNVKQEYLNQTKFLDFILKFIELKNTKYFENISEESIVSTKELVKLISILIELEKISINIDKKYAELNRFLAEILLDDKYIKLKQFYSSILNLNLIKNLNDFHKIKNTVNKKISELQNTNYSFYIKIAIGFVVLSALSKK